VQGVKLPFIRGLEFPIVPFKEQERIVGVLDQAFEAIATSENSCKVNSSKMKQLSDSIFEELLRSEVASREMTTLGATGVRVATGPFGTMLHKSDYVSVGTPLVNPLNMVDERIVASSRMMIDEKTRP